MVGLLFYICNMKRIIITLIFLAAGLSLNAGTPAEDLMDSYAKEKGIQVVHAKGGLMVFARSAIRKTPLGPLADVVQEVTVCKMPKATEVRKEEFLQKLRRILKEEYIYYGIKPGEEGRPVEVYGCPVQQDIVKELVVFNPKDHSLFSLIGDFGVQDLMNLDKNK